MSTTDETSVLRYLRSTTTLQSWSDMLVNNGHMLTKDELDQALAEMEHLTLSLRIMLNRGNLDSMLKRPKTRNC